MMLKEQKPKPNLSQQQAPTKKVPQPPSARIMGFTGLQPRYYETGAKPSVFPTTFVHSGRNTNSGGPAYVYDAADRIRAPFAENRSPSALSGQKTIQRMVKVKDVVVSDVTFKAVQAYIKTLPPGTKPKNEKKAANGTLNTIRDMIREENADDPYCFNNMEELMKAAYDKYSESLADPGTVNGLVEKIDQFYGQVTHDMPNILHMTPTDFEAYMIASLRIPNLTIAAQASTEYSLTCIVRNYQSPISHIAGTITYTYQSRYFKLFMEIHPKGGIHYGAYFLIEFSYGGQSKKRKMIHSKPSTYLPAGEADRELDFRHREVPPSFMPGLPARHYQHPQEGIETPDRILNIPIQDIFSKKGMTRGSVWTEETRASVESQRDEIRRARITKIAGLEPIDLSLIEKELMMIDKRLDSLETELSDPSSIDPARCDSISHELERIRSSLDGLEAIIDDLIAKREQA